MIAARLGHANGFADQALPEPSAAAFACVRQALCSEPMCPCGGCLYGGHIPVSELEVLIASDALEADSGTWLGPVFLCGIALSITTVVITVAALRSLA